MHKKDEDKLEGKALGSKFSYSKRMRAEKRKNKEETKDTKLGKIRFRKENQRKIGEGQKE